jgi:hypothetical protein
MHSRMVEVREGDNVGPVDWEHPTAKAMPEHWREAEQHPERFTFNGRSIVQICMYDGWPYWTPRPAVMYIGPMRSAQWDFFDSYGVWPGSICRCKL